MMVLRSRRISRQLDEPAEPFTRLERFLSTSGDGQVYITSKEVET
jgi:hypothetical protein